MSDSLIAFHPAIELPSNMKPSVSMSSSITPEAMVRCCHLPLGSVKRRSTHSISSSVIREMSLLAWLAIGPVLDLLLHLARNSDPDAPGSGAAEARDSSLWPSDSRTWGRSQRRGEHFNAVAGVDRDACGRLGNNPCGEPFLAPSQTRNPRLSGAPNAPPSAKAEQVVRARPAPGKRQKGQDGHQGTDRTARHSPYADRRGGSAPGFPQCRGGQFRGRRDRRRACSADRPD